MAWFNDLRLTNPGAAENRNNLNQGHAKEQLFLAPCTVEETRRDAGQMPFRYSLNDVLDLAPELGTCPGFFVIGAQLLMERQDGSAQIELRF
jgi:hypothetical protein